MPSLFALTAPLALLFPVGGDAGLAREPHAGRCAIEPQVLAQTREGDAGYPAMPLSDVAPIWSSIFDVEPRQSRQVRIEGRVTLRISPAQGAMRQSMMAETAPASRMRLEERPFGSCVDTRRIGAVADRGDRLMLFLRDRRTLSAQLEKGCSPREFYQGFYMEPADDGMLCVNRDRLMSRSGAKCQVARLREMVLRAED